MSNSSRYESRAMQLSVTQTVGYPSGNTCNMVTTRYDAPQPVVDSVGYSDNYPNWRQLIATGQSATTHMEGIKRTWSHSVGVCKVRIQPYLLPQYEVYECEIRRDARGHNLNATQFPYENNYVSPEAQSQASSSLLQSLTSAQTSWRGSNFVAEFRETVKMFRRPLEGIHQHTWKLIRKTTSMKRLFRRSPREYGKLLGNAWLSWSFGVRPAISDITELQNALQEMGLNLSSRDRLPIEGFGSESWTYPYWLGRAGSIGFEMCENDEWRTGLSTVRYKGAVVATPPGIQAVLQNLGFTPEDILPAVWEAVPWSFLFDYFVNVNEQIEALRWMSANVAWLNETQRTTAQSRWTSWRPRPQFAPMGYLVTCSGGSAWNATTWVKRRPISSPPMPPWNFRIPGSLEKWINISALAAGIRASKPL